MAIFKKNWYILFLVAISILPLFDLFHPGLPITHDGQDHVARIATFYQNLSEGVVIPRWAGGLNWGYGHPILMFLYPLPSYIASFFHFLGFGLVDSVKIVFGLAFVVSGIPMYLWIRDSFKSSSAGFIAGVLYLFAPYRFVDLYVRGAIGEHVAFIFPPLLCYFLLKLSKKYSWETFIGGSLSVAGLLLSHNAISIMFFPLLLSYAIYIVVTNKKRAKMLTFLYVTMFGIGGGLASFFILPAFFEGKYTLRDIVTKNEYAKRFVEFSTFFAGKWNYGGSGQFSTQVGLVQLLALLGSIPISFYYYRRRKPLWIITTCLLLITFLTLFLMTSSSNFIWQHVSLITKFQFPWRFLSVVVFTASVLGGVLVATLPKNKRMICAVGIAILALLLTKDEWHAKDYLYKPESFFTNVYYGTTDTGESAPIWSVRFMEKPPNAPIEVIEGTALIDQLMRTSVMHTYIITASESSKIVENTLYFPGWVVYVDKRSVPIEFQDQMHRGLMTFKIAQGRHDVEVKFTQTRLRTFAEQLSLFSFLLMVLLAIIFQKRKAQRI